MQDASHTAPAESLVDYAYHDIRKKIELGFYPPGTKLSTQKISDALGISRTPVVSALNRLVAEGITESRPRRGIFVMRLSGKKIRDLIEARTMIEVFSVKSAVENLNFYPGILGRMEQILEQFQKVGDYDYELASEAEFQFHSSFVLLSGNEELKKMYNANWGLGATYYMYTSCHVPLSQRTIALQGHPQLLELLKAQKVEELQKALHSHIFDALRFLNWLIDTHPDYFG